MRRKVYTKEQILTAAYDMISKDGFNKFTARNLAKNMGISTQPIYLEFKNMQDLKNTLIEMIFRDLKKGILSKKITGDEIIDFGLNYIEFAQKNRDFYSVLFVDQNGGGEHLYKLIYEHFHNLAMEDPAYQDATEAQIKAMNINGLITVAGIATLKSSSVLILDQEDIIQRIQRSLADGLAEGATQE